MRISNKKQFDLRNPQAELQEALHKLERFTQGLEEGKDPVSQAKPSTWVKMLGLAKRWITTTLFPRAREKQINHNRQLVSELQHAVDTVKSHYLFIKCMPHPEAEGQKLADRAIAVIEQYNALIDASQEAPKGVAGEITQFLQKSLQVVTPKTKITLPEPAMMRAEHLPKGARSPMAEKINRTIDPNGGSVLPQSERSSQEEVDAFRAKTLALFQRHGFPSLTIQETLKSIRQTPIQTTVVPEEQEGDIVQMEQSLSFLPGEVTILRGAFKRGPLAYSIPISESFQLSTCSMQTGFPHPSQHTGWALSDTLIPPCPHRYEDLPLFAPWHVLKESTAQALLPKGTLIAQAKEHLKTLKEVFDNTRSFFLGKHRTHALALLHLAPEESVLPDAEAIVHAFFDQIKEQPKAYDALAEAHHTLVKQWIDTPYHALHHAWMEKQHPELLSPCADASYQAAVQVMEIERKKVHRDIAAQKSTDPSDPENIVIDYLLVMGNILGPRCQAIQLQHLSEAFKFRPPELTDFEKRIQMSVYKQLGEFLESFESETPDIDMDHRLETDLLLFQAKSLEGMQGRTLDIVNELERYYALRFTSP